MAVQDPHDIYGRPPLAPEEESADEELPSAGINRRMVHRNWLLAGGLFVVGLAVVGSMVMLVDRRLELMSAPDQLTTLPDSGDLEFLPGLASNEVRRVRRDVDDWKRGDSIYDQSPTNSLSLEGVTIGTLGPDPELDWVNLVVDEPGDNGLIPSFNVEQGSALASMMELAEEFYRNEAYDDVVRTLEHALDRDPNLIPALELLGVAYLEEREEAAAIEVYLRLTQLRPTQSSYFNNLALAQTRLGRLQDAEESLLAALQLDGDNADALVNIGLLSFKKEEYREATRYLKRAPVLRKFKRNPGVLYGIGVSELHLGNLEQARDALQDLVQILPKRADTYFLIAESFMKENADNDAMAWLKLGSEHTSEEEFVRLTQGNVFDRLRNSPRFERMSGIFRDTEPSVLR